MGQKEIRINKILDNVGQALEAKGVKYSLNVVDGNKAYTRSNIKGEDMAFPTDSADQLLTKV